MGNPSWTTPKTIEEQKKKKFNDEIKSSKASIVKGNDLERNMDHFFNGYEKVIMKHYDELEKSKELKSELELEIKRQLEDDRITETVAEEKMEQIKSEMLTLQETTTEMLEDLANRLKELFKEEESLEGAKIDDSDMKLLNSGITLSQNELESLVSKHKKNNNITMLRVLKEHAEARGLYVSYKTADERIKAIDMLLSQSKAGIEDPYGYFGVQDKTAHHRHTLFNQVRSWIL